MFDLVCIFTTGGVILFYKAFCVLKFDILDCLIKKVLLQEKQSESSYFVEPYVVKWKLANEFNLIITAVYQEMFHLTYVEDLLGLIRDNYVKTIIPSMLIQDGIYKKIASFDEKFEECMKEWEKDNHRKDKKASIMRGFNKDTKKANETSGNETKEKKKTMKEKNKILDENDKSTVSDIKKSQSSETNSVDDEVLKSRIKLAQRFTEKKPSKEAEKPVVADNTAKKAKEKTQWSTIKENISNQDMKKFDCSTEKLNKEDAMEAEYKSYRDKYLGGEKEKIPGFIDDDDEDSSDDDDGNGISEIKPKSKGLFSRLTDSFKTITGNKVITNEDVESLLVKFKEDLMNKNVGEEISQRLCDSIRTSLIDKKTQAFTSLKRTVKNSLEEALTKILTPKKNINIISEAMKARETGKPYVLVFIGVNGVGKSTNLAKVAYLFKTQGFSVMLAACDNFRAGAVEQIKTHGRCLDLPVYDRGYKEDPAEIAQKAIREATVQKKDIVLIDTAGRMQDNEPLMKALSRLIVLNQPDLVIFIGEALTGNDASDQLMKFNKAIIDLSPKDNIREIDAIILSKFDTVDEKVGTAISLTYATGKPILFCGVGQKYTHLKKLNVKTVVNALLS